MPLKIQGGIATFSIQPGRTVVEKNDGTLEGSVTYKTDRNKESFLPDIGSRHPDDPRLEMFQRSKTYGNNLEISQVASFFGLINSPTDKVITYSGGQNNDAIETHEDFAEFAGKLGEEKNGAVFDAESGFFLKFAEDNEFRGTEYYFTPATLVTLSYWTEDVPKLKSRMTIVKDIPGFKSPPDVTEYLHLKIKYISVFDVSCLVVLIIKYIENLTVPVVVQVCQICARELSFKRPFLHKHTRPPGKRYPRLDLFRPLRLTYNSIIDLPTSSCGRLLRRTKPDICRKLGNSSFKT